MASDFLGVTVLPDGTSVRGRGRRDGVPGGVLPSYGLYLGRPPDVPRPWFALRRKEVWQPAWAADWIDWPDFRTPRDSGAAAAAIQHAFQRARDGEHVEVACHGGTGRTGTVVACMAVLAGHPVEDAVDWARRHYRPRAVETRGQRRWVTWFATAVRI
jgi:hypothetical protein